MCLRTLPPAFSLTALLLPLPAFAQSATAGLADPDWRTRNRTAAALAAALRDGDTSAVRDLSVHVRQPAATAVSDRPAAAFNDRAHVLRFEATTFTWDSAHALVDGVQRSIPRPGSIPTTRPARDPHLLLPWGTRTLATWVLSHTPPAHHASTAAALDAPYPGPLSAPFAFQLVATLTSLGDPGHKVLVRLAREHATLSPYIGFHWSAQGPAGQPHLRALLLHPDPIAQRTALEHLEPLATAAGRWVLAHRQALLDIYLSGPDDLSRAAAPQVYHLRTHTYPALLAALDQADSQPRRRAAVMLGALRGDLPRYVLAAIRRRPRDADQLVDHPLILALGKCDDPRTVEHLFAMLRESPVAGADFSNDRLRKFYVLAALADRPRPFTRPQLDHLRRIVAERHNEPAQAYALECLQRAEALDHLSLRDLEAAFWGPNYTHKIHALRAVCMHGRRALPLLRRAFAKMPLRPGMARLISVPISPFFRAGVGVDAPPLPDQLVRACAHLGPGAAAEMRTWLRDASPWVRAAALHALSDELAAGLHLKVAEALLDTPSRSSVLALLIQHAPRSPACARILRSVAATGDPLAVQSLLDQGHLAELRTILRRLLAMRPGQVLALAPYVAKLPAAAAFDAALLRMLSAASPERARAIFALWRWRVQPIVDVPPAAVDAALRTIAATPSSVEAAAALHVLTDLFPPTTRTLTRLAAIVTRRERAHDDRFTHAVLRLSERLAK